MFEAELLEVSSDHLNRLIDQCLFLRLASFPLSLFNIQLVIVDPEFLNKISDFLFISSGFSSWLFLFFNHNLFLLDNLKLASGKLLLLWFTCLLPKFSTFLVKLAPLLLVLASFIELAWTTELFILTLEVTLLKWLRPWTAVGWVSTCFADLTLSLDFWLHTK